MHIFYRMKLLKKKKIIEPTKESSGFVTHFWSKWFSGIDILKHGDECVVVFIFFVFASEDLGNILIVLNGFT